MSHAREKYGVVFTCDQCGDTHSDDEKNFTLALDQAKEAGWLPVNIGGIWHHFCGRVCKRAFMDAI